MRRPSVARRCRRASARWLAASTLALLSLLAVPALADEPPMATPALDWDTPVRCMHDSNGVAIRVQCDEDLRRCLVAPDAQSNDAPLRRTQSCASYNEDYDALLADGYRMVAARAEAPHGWWRDELGRVSQIDFDLWRRIYLGAAWAPRVQLDASDVPDDEISDLERVRFDLGLVASFRSSPETRHTFRALEGTLALSDLASRGVVLDYEMRHHSDDPLFRIVTFFGRPRRYDVRLDMGWGARLGEVASEHRDERAHTDIDFLSGRVGWDLYLSPDLSNRVRLGTGLGLGAVWSEITGESSQLYVQPGVDVESQFVVDDSGLHNLVGAFRYEAFGMLQDEGRELDAWRHRLSLVLGYEWIFLSINDQPLSLNVETRAAWRDDIPGTGQFWDLTAITGLRFSLWAPAREPADHDASH